MDKLSRREIKWRIRSGSEYITLCIGRMYCFSEQIVDADVTHVIHVIRKLVEIVDEQSIYSRRFIYRNLWRWIQSQLPYIICDLSVKYYVNHPLNYAPKHPTKSLYTVTKEFFNWLSRLLSKHAYISDEKIMAKLGLLLSGDQ